MSNLFFFILFKKNFLCNPLFPIPDYKIGGTCFLIFDKNFFYFFLF